MDDARMWMLDKQAHPPHKVGRKVVALQIKHGK
jgi:hypothetical protein